MSNEVKIPTEYEMTLGIIKKFIKYADDNGFTYNGKDWRKGIAFTGVTVKSTEELLWDSIHGFHTAKKNGA